MHLEFHVKASVRDGSFQHCFDLAASKPLVDHDVVYMNDDLDAGRNLWVKPPLSPQFEQMQSL